MTAAAYAMDTDTAPPRPTGAPTVNVWVCLDCGARQPEAGTCRACKSDEVLDARKEDVRALMADVELRLRDRREARMRWGSVAIGVGVVVLLWMIPGYWAARRQVFALPVLMDQWGLMILIAFGVLKIGDRVLAHKRFPYLDEQQHIVD